MRAFIRTLLFGIVGGTLASANVTPFSWQFWVVVVCMVGVGLCSYDYNT